MNLPRSRERRIRLALYLLILAVFVLYAGQFAIFKLRFLFLDAEVVETKIQNEACDAQNCVGTFLLQPAKKYLLVGHVMRYHSIFNDSDGKEIFPISAVRGVANEAWLGLRVYPVEPNATYRLVATKPKAVRMGYFVGVLPRTTDHEGVLSVPDISPTVSTIATMSGFGILAILIFAAYLAPASGAGAKEERERLEIVAASSFAAVIVSVIVTGMVDSLMPDGELRSRILRTAAVNAVMIGPFGLLLRNIIRSNIVSIGITVLLVSLIVNLNWAYFRAGATWAVSYALIVLSMSWFMFVRGFRVAGVLSLLSLVDSAKMMGALPLVDIPPTYLLQSILVASFSLVAADSGAISVLSLAARAYQRFMRDIALNQISSILGTDSSATEGDISEAVKAALPKISQLTGAGRVSILINLPFARPITHAYTVDNQNTVTHDDGQIPGAVTVRAFVYGDEAWFEKYSEFAKRLAIPHASHLTKAEYVCIAPIRVNKANMGVLMLTCFDDDHVDRQISKGGIEDDREAGRAVVDVIASRFSDVLINTMESSSELSTDLLARIREAIPASASTGDFLQRYCQAAFEVTGMRTMIHQWIGDKGVAMAQSGIDPQHWQLFVESPFNLSPSAKTAYGSTVVAFREQKPSYIKNWHEIREKLHPKTAGMLDQMEVCSFLAVPLSSGGERFVATMMSRRDEAPRDPGLMRIIEASEAIFDAAVTVLQQRTSVLALGKLANRLIGDDDVRVKIVEAAKQESLQTTIGTPRTSFLLLFDLCGSSQLPADTEEKARSYGNFYDEVNKVSQRLLGGKVRKTIGDAVIVTWDGTKTKLEESDALLARLGAVVRHADEIAKKVGCQGVRAVLHHGDYFFGLIGTSSFGQIDVIGKGIDEVCKMEGAMKTSHLRGEKVKIALSTAAVGRLSRLNPDLLVAGGYEDVSGSRDGIVARANEICWATVRVAFREEEIDEHIEVKAPPLVAS